MFPPPPPASPRPRHAWLDVPVARAHGRRGESVFGGVVGGLSNAFGFDRRLARIVVVVLTFALPTTILVYLALWYFLPAHDAQPASLRQLATERHRLPLLALLVVALALSGALIPTGDFIGDRGLGWAIVLIVLGVFLWVTPDRGRRPSQPPAPAAPRSDATDRTTWAAPVADSPSTAWTGSSGSTAPTVSSASSAYYAPPPAMVATSYRRRYPIGALAIALATMAVGFVLAGISLGWWNAPIYATLLVACGVLALAALVSAIVNRHYGRITLIVPIAAVALFLAITKPAFAGGVGTRTVNVATADDLVARQRLAIGTLDIDASKLASSVSEDKAVVRASVDVGRLHIIVPNGAVIVVDGHVGAGQIDIDSHELVAGLNVDHHQTYTPPAGTTVGPTIRLDVKVGAGEIAVQRAPAGGTR